MIPCRPNWWAARPTRWQGSHGTPQRIEVERDGVSVLAHAQIEQVRDVDVDGEEAPRAEKLGAHPFHTVHEGAVGLDDDAGFGTAEVRARCRREARGSGAW
jgi:hypothetical protein